jgi:hypothetical protein
MIFTHIILYRQNTYRYIQIHTNTCTHSLHPAGLPCVGTLIPSATPSWCSRSKCLGCKLSKIPSASCVYMYLHVCVCMCMSALWFFLSHWHRIDTYRYIKIHTYMHWIHTQYIRIHTNTYNCPFEVKLPRDEETWTWSGHLEETFRFTAGTRHRNAVDFDRIFGVYLVVSVPLPPFLAYNTWHLASKCSHKQKFQDSPNGCSVWVICYRFEHFFQVSRIYFDCSFDLCCKSALLT